MIHATSDKKGKGKGRTNVESSEGSSLKAHTINLVSVFVPINSCGEQEQIAKVIVDSKGAQVATLVLRDVDCRSNHRKQFVVPINRTLYITGECFLNYSKQKGPGVNRLLMCL